MSTPAGTDQLRQILQSIFVYRQLLAERRENGALLLSFEGCLELKGYEVSSHEVEIGLFEELLISMACC